ncbi:calcyphosin-2 isoform X3 [Aphelocoma coerulescens]|uniref:calcyphosin-2 isoform X3 n=1 Tax=Aphelocoma coerulescens TaxID=39617 RepID=UPI0036052C32
MDLEAKGLAASPRRKAELSLRGKKCQGWRPNRQAAHSPRPPEVPCLDLGRLGDSDEEDGDSYLPYTGSCSHRCPLHSASDWRTSLQTPYVQHQHKTRPENLPSPTERNKLKYGQYEADTKEEYKQHPQRIAEKKKDHLQCPDSSIKGTQLEDGHNDDFVTLDKKALLQQCYTNKPYNMQHNIRKSEAFFMAGGCCCREEKTDCCRTSYGGSIIAVISDPEQSTCSDACKEAQGLLGVGTAPMRFRKRTLHETKNGHDACRELVGFFFACDKSLTVYEFRQFGKNRTNALPFIQKGIYQHQRGQRKGKAYDLSDFYIGANLTFRSVDHNLPESVKQNPVFTLRVINIDEAAMDYLKASSVELKQECSRQVVDDSEVFKKIQGIFRETLSKRGVRVITGLGKYFRQIDKKRNGLLSQAALKEALKVFHLEMPEGDFKSLWLILDDSKSDKVDYGEFTHAIFGEMNEYRKASVRKAYMKLDFNKTGSVPVADVRKCYCAKKHPLVLAGKAAEEEIKSSFLETLGESCSNPNEVSYSEFEDYYEGLSFGIMGDDDFVNILRNSWGI